RMTRNDQSGSSRENLPAPFEFVGPKIARLNDPSRHGDDPADEHRPSLASSLGPDDDSEPIPYSCNCSKPSRRQDIRVAALGIGTSGRRGSRSPIPLSFRGDLSAGNRAG